MEKKFNYTYKITNLINRKYYYGCHSTNDAFGDGYMGSGILINKAYKKYGIENFEKEMLENFSTNKKMYEAEKELISENVVKDRMCYNIKTGGTGFGIWTKELGFDFIPSKENCKDKKQFVTDIGVAFV